MCITSLPVVWVLKVKLGEGHAISKSSVHHSKSVLALIVLDRVWR